MENFKSKSLLNKPPYEFPQLKYSTKERAIYKSVFLLEDDSNFIQGSFSSDAFEEALRIQIPQTMRYSDIDVHV